MQKSARAIYGLSLIFSQAPAVENFKFPARFFKFYFKNPARFFKSRGRGRRFFSISVSKFPPRFFPARRTCFHKVDSKIRLRFFKFRFQISQRFFQAAHSGLAQKPSKKPFPGQ